MLAERFWRIEALAKKKKVTFWVEGFAKMNFPSFPFKIPPASPVLTLQLCPQLAVPQWGLVGDGGG